MRSTINTILLKRRVCVPKPKVDTLSRLFFYVDLLASATASYLEMEKHAITQVDLGLITDRN